MAFLLRQLRMRFISVQCNFSVFLGVKHESDNKSHPCLDQASGTTGRLRLHRPPPPPLLSCSPSLMPVKGSSCRAWIHLCGTTTEKPPKALNSSSSLPRPPARPALPPSLPPSLSLSLPLRLSQLHRRAVPYELLPAESLLLL